MILRYFLRVTTNRQHITYYKHIVNCFMVGGDSRMCRFCTQYYFINCLASIRKFGTTTRWSLRQRHNALQTLRMMYMHRHTYVHLCIYIYAYVYVYTAFLFFFRVCTYIYLYKCPKIHGWKYTYTLISIHCHLSSETKNNATEGILNVFLSTD